MPDARQWINQSQPQTLLIACFLLYFNAALSVLSLLVSGSIGGLGLVGLLYYGAIIGGGVLAGRGIATEKKWGWALGLVVALLPFVIRLVFLPSHNPFSTDLIGLIFEIALVALLVHPMSREYKKIWFR